MIDGFLISGDIWERGNLLPSIWVPDELSTETYKENSVINIGNDLLESICLSLFTERRFRFVDGESPSDDRRGWWYDSVRGDQDLTGSLLWTLDFRAMTGSIIEDATQYAKDALKWLTEDGVASKVDVVVSRVQGENETLLFQVDVYRPDELQPLKYQIIWDAYRAFIDPSIVSIPESILSLPLSFGYGSGAGEDMVLDPDAYKEPSVINIGDDLYESICISLFTEKRFRFVDGESPSDDRRGWWFDSVRGDQDLTGSLLWTLDFRAMAGNIIDDATQYAKDALKWLTDDGVASRVEVVVTRTANETLSFAVDVYRPDELQPLKYQIIWDASLNYIKNGEL